MRELPSWQKHANVHHVGLEKLCFKDPLQGDLTPNLELIMPHNNFEKKKPRQKTT